MKPARFWQSGGITGASFLLRRSFCYEVANALAKRIQRREFTLEQARERLRFFLESEPLLQQIGAVHPRALELMEVSVCRRRMMLITWRWRNPSAASVGPPTNGYGTRSKKNSARCAG
jgi:hypothetical protein